MKQRETMFCEGLVEKATPSRHFKKRSIHEIAQTTGIDFKKGHEFGAAREKTSAGTRNPITGQNVPDQFYRRCQQSGPTFAGWSLEINPTGITESKKRLVRDDGIKANRVVAVDVSSFKYRDQEKQGRVNNYMNSSQMKNIMSVENERSYKGLVSK